MSATGIGAAVRRKEDFRFVTGKGQYTDDIDRPGQSYIHFLRSPHAHAKIKSIDTKAAAAMPGVLAVLTGADLAADKIGGLICGWMIHSKDGSPMKAAPHPAIAHAKACYVGDPVAVVIAETLEAARDAAEKIAVDYEVLPAVADPATAASAIQIHEVAPHNTIYQWHLGDAKAVEQAFKSAAHVTKLDLVNNRLVPNAMEPRAAIGDYDAGTASFTLWNTTQNPHVARLVISAFIGMAPEHKLRVIAPDVGGGFGSKIFIYPEEVVCLWAAKKVGRPVKWVAERSESFIADAHGRDHVTHAEMALDAGGQDHRAARQDHRQSRRLHVDVLLFGADLSLRDAALGAVRHPAHLLRGRCGLHQHRAGRRLSRRRAPRGDLRDRAPARGERPPARPVAGGAAAQELHREIPAPDAGDHELRRRRLRRLAQEGARARRRRAFSEAQARVRAPRQAARHRASPPTSRPAASRRARRSARSAAAWACGNPPRCGSTRPAASRS